MRLNAVPENLFERVVLRAGVVPMPLGDTIVAMTLARTIMVATKLGVFEALAKEESTAHEIAACGGLDQHATEVLLFALAGAGYVRCKGMRYTLAPVAQKWLLKSSPQSLYDYMLFNFLNWSWDERFEDFIRTGKPTQIHQELSQEEWQIPVRSGKRSRNLVHQRDCSLATRGWLAPSQVNRIVHCARCKVTGSIQTERQRYHVSLIGTSLATQNHWTVTFDQEQK